MEVFSNLLFYSYMNCRKSQVLRQISKKVPVEFLFHNAYELPSHIYQEIMVKGKNGWIYPWKVQIENKALGVTLVERKFEDYQQARSYIINCLKNNTEVYIWAKNKWIPHMELTNSDPEGEHSLTLTSYENGTFSVVDYPFEQAYAEHVIKDGFDHIPIDGRIVTSFIIEDVSPHQDIIDPIKRLFKEAMLAVKEDFSLYDNIVRGYSQLGFETWLTRSIQVFGVISLSRLLTSIFMRHAYNSETTIRQMQNISKAAENIKNYLMKSSFAPQKFDIADFQQRCTMIRELEESALMDLQNELLTGIKKNQLQAKLNPPSQCRITYTTDTSLWLEWKDEQREYEQIEYEIWLNHTRVGVTSGTQYTLGGLEPSHDYTITIKAKNQLGQFSEGVQLEARTSELMVCGNLALYKPVKASSTETVDFACSHVVDNDPHTRWSSDYRDDQWICVDLGLSKKISKIRLHWEGAHPSKYRIESSNNSEDWELIHDEEAGCPGLFELDNLDLIGRFVRVTCIRRATIFGFSLFEFSVFNESNKPFSIQYDRRNEGLRNGSNNS